MGGWPRVGAVPTLGLSVRYEKYAVVTMRMTRIRYDYDCAAYYRARYYDEFAATLKILLPPALRR